MKMPSIKLIQAGIIVAAVVADPCWLPGERKQMPVYVDNLAAKFGRMKMCHMTADTSAELLAMADRIGVAQRWLQCAGTPREHFDICMSRRVAAVREGAMEIDVRETAMLVRRKRLLDLTTI